MGLLYGRAGRLTAQKRRFPARAVRVGGEFLLVPTDWWAFGCLMHQLLTGDIPFYADDVKTNRRRILSDKPKFAKFLILAY
jgi:hypothetical protein